MLSRLEETAGAITYQSGFKRRALTRRLCRPCSEGKHRESDGDSHVQRDDRCIREHDLAGARHRPHPRRRRGVAGRRPLQRDHVKKRVVWAAALSPGSHTLQVSASGTRNAASTANRIDVDAFLIR